METSTRIRRLQDLGVLGIDVRLTNTSGKEIVLGHGAVLNLAFRVRPRSEDARYQQLTYRNDEWYGSTYYTGPDWTRVGKNWHHPGQNTPSVRCFRSPRDGRATLTGRVYKLHRQGDGIRARIVLGQQELWKTEIGGADGKGIEPKLTVDLGKGDRLRFIVEKRGSITCDTTGWDPIITFDDGERFQASKAFTGKQGAGGWFYEMVANGKAGPTEPSVHSLAADLSLRESIVTEARPLAFSAAEVLPFVAIADGRDKSGVVIASDPERPWAFRAELTVDGLLRVALLLDAKGGKRRLGPGKAATLPPVILSAYDGGWTASFELLERIATSDSQISALGRAIENAYRQFLVSYRHRPELSLFLMIEAEWRREDKIRETTDSYAPAVADHLARSRKLLDEISHGAFGGDFAKDRAHLERISAEAKRPDLKLNDWRRLYLTTRLLKRQIVFSNPLLDFGKLLFGKRRLCRWSHMNMQYFGFRARAGGGLFVLEEPGTSSRTRNVVGDQLPPGSFLEPRLSFDGKRIVFSFVKCGDKELDAKALRQNEEGEDFGYYHIYEIKADGSGLRKLTRGPYDDLMPNYLPDGGIVFCSTRRKSYSRCFGPNYSRRWHSFTLHRMDRDGDHLRILSHNDVTEWFPVVSNSGRILFSRWDYIDRDAVTHQNLWAMHPDGTNPVAVWGNASPKPNCTFQIQPVPNSTKIAVIPSAHHALTGGPVCLIDPSVDSNSSLAAITRITPQPFPEAEGWDLPDYYEFAWPLSEQYFLVGYSNSFLRSQGKSYTDPTPDNALGIYLIDARGNRELLYRDPALNSSAPIPLRPRPRPPILQESLPDQAPPFGEMLLSDVYQGLGPVRRGTIHSIRIIQIFPKVTPYANNPLIGFAGEENARAILGTVPVEPDGSARFRVPANKLLLFQALDANGFAYQTMRSTTSVQPGEVVSCIGCHENRMTAPPAQRPLASLRPASRIDPGELGGEPFSYTRVVQPVLDRHCIQCHGKEKKEKGLDLRGEPYKGFTRSYWSLCGQPRRFSGRNTNAKNAAQALVPCFGQRNQVQRTPPGGRYGARGSRLLKLLLDGHENVRLKDRELRRLAAWIDCNAIFYGAYLPDRMAAQLAGKRIEMPDIQ